jgi:hypothetical protein
VLLLYGFRALRRSRVNSENSQARAASTALQPLRLVRGNRASWRASTSNSAASPSSDLNRAVTTALLARRPAVLSSATSSEGSRSWWR